MTVTVEPLPKSDELFVCVPKVEEIRTIISRCFDKILRVPKHIPRIESILFPEFKDAFYMLPVFRKEEQVSVIIKMYLKPKLISKTKILQVKKIIEEALNAVTMNNPGPDLYLQCYNESMYILNGAAEKELMDYFESDPEPTLKEFSIKIRSYNQLRDQLFSFRTKVPLNLIELDCHKVNEALHATVEDLKMTICNTFAKELHDTNVELCRVFTEIANNISAMPDTTVEVVELLNYLNESRDNTMFNLKTKIIRSCELILFLFDQKPPSDEDIRLNTRAITWPNDMETSMDLANTRLMLRKEYVEGVLKTRRDEFDVRIQNLLSAVERFKRKDPPVLMMDEMEDNAREAHRLYQETEEVRKESIQINEEETLLDMETSPFIKVPGLVATMEIFERLWSTVLSFHRNYEKWFYGPFLTLDAEAVEEETENIWRVLYKLSRSLQELPSARRIADIVRGKVDKFKQFVPVLQTICNPGLRDRHWMQIGDIVGKEIALTETSSLSDMIDFGMPLYVNKLEEISLAATKEHALEKNLEKMKEEWSEVHFELTLYRDTGISILTAIDDIQVLLDDHILKVYNLKKFI